MASIVAMAVAVPMAIGSVPTSATVNDVATDYTCDATLSTAPTAGSDGQVDFTLTATDNNGDDDIFGGPYWAEWDAGAGARTTELTDPTGPNGDLVRTFTGNDAVPYTTPEGTYTVYFYKDGGDGVRSADDIQVGTDTFAVGGYTGFTIDFTEVNYGAVNISEKKTVSGDANMGTPSAQTIKNTGNKVMDVTISATDLTGADTIDNINLGAAVDITSEQNLDDVRTFDANIDPDNTAKIDYTLTAPQGSKPVAYSGTTTVTGIESTP